MKQTFELTQDWIPVTHNGVEGFVLVDRDRHNCKIGDTALDGETGEITTFCSSCGAGTRKIIATSPNLSLDDIPHIDLPKRVEEDVEKLAILFHDTYERLAPAFGYETRNDTKIFNPNSPNGKLMIAVCKEIYKANKKSFTEEGLIKFAEWITKIGKFDSSKGIWYNYSKEILDLGRNANTKELLQVFIQYLNQPTDTIELEVEGISNKSGFAYSGLKGNKYKTYERDGKQFLKFNYINQ